MVKVYQSCRIHVVTKLNLDSDCWVPEAQVLWEEHGNRRHQRLKGPDDRFRIIDEAQLYAIEMAKSWINDELKYKLPSRNVQRLKYQLQPKL